MTEIGAKASLEQQPVRDRRGPRGLLHACRMTLSRARRFRRVHGIATEHAVEADALLVPEEVDLVAWVGCKVKRRLVFFQLPS